MTIEWKQEDSVGVKEMDLQHKMILGSLSALREGIKIDNSDEAVNNLFNEAKKHINTHFEAEEKYLNEFHCDSLVEHKSMHDNYRDMFFEIIKMHNNESKNSILSLIEMISKWFITHINVVDKRYTDCFHEHGLN